MPDFLASLQRKANIPVRETFLSVLNLNLV